MTNGYNFVFFGTPAFAATILEKLAKSGIFPTLAVCNPDQPTGRKKALTAPPVKRLIVNSKLQIKILQPENLRTISHKLFAFGPDFGVVAAYNKIIPKEVIEGFPLGIIGVHPSLLPKYRGPSPIQTAILDGVTETGVTLYLLDEKIDHGPIIAQRKLTTYNLQLITYEELLKKLAELGAELLIETLPKFIKGEIKPASQNEAEATYTKKFKTEDGFVELVKDAPDFIARKIMALTPEPGVYTIKDGKRLKLLEVQERDGKFIITKTQWEGKTPQSAELIL